MATTRDAHRSSVCLDTLAGRCKKAARVFGGRPLSLRGDGNASVMRLAGRCAETQCLRVRSFVVNTRPIIPLVALLLVAAWPFPVEGSASGDSRVITREELERCWAKTPLEAVVALRPLWLSNRGVSGLFDPFGPVVTKLTGMAVYVDGIRRGGIG